jgi:hypothetical protein
MAMIIKFCQKHRKTLQKHLLDFELGIFDSAVWATKSMIQTFSESFKSPASYDVVQLSLSVASYMKLGYSSS